MFNAQDWKCTPRNVLTPVDAEIIAQCSLSVRHRRAVELLVVRKLLEELVAEGFQTFFVDNGDDPPIPCGTPDAVVEEVFAVDESRIHARNSYGRASWAYIVLGNDGWDAISDYSCLDPLFDRALERVHEWCDEQEAAGA